MSNSRAKGLMGNELQQETGRLCGMYTLLEGKSETTLKTWECMGGYY